MQLPCNELRIDPDEIETASSCLSGSRRMGRPLYLVPDTTALTGLTMFTCFELLGPGPAMQIAWYVLFGSIGWRLLYFMESVDQPVGNEPAPNSTATLILLVTSVLLFWVPVIGIALLSYAIYRSRWLQVSDAVLAPFAVLFFLSFAATLVAAIVVAEQRSSTPVAGAFAVETPNRNVAAANREVREFGR